MEFDKGSILFGSKRGKLEAKHPIIFWESNSDNSFIGVVLTHSKKYKNVSMKKEFFLESASHGFKLEETRPSHIVPCLFLKPADWGPYIKCGQLSKIGIKFVAKVVKKTKPTYWETYIKDSA